MLVLHSIKFKTETTFYEVSRHSHAADGEQLYTVTVSSRTDGGFTQSRALSADDVLSYLHANGARPMELDPLAAWMDAIRFRPEQQLEGEN